jgi:hypothetical protein
VFTGDYMRKYYFWYLGEMNLEELVNDLSSVSYIFDNYKLIFCTASKKYENAYIYVTFDTEPYVGARTLPLDYIQKMQEQDELEDTYCGYPRILPPLPV